MTTAKLTNYSQHANQTVIVSSTAELQAAIAQLDTSGGGTILVDGNSGPYTMKALQVGGTDSPIKITSVDTGNPAQFTQIDIDQSSHLTLTGIHVEDPALNSPSDGINTEFDIKVYYSNHIEIGNITMDGGGTEFFDPNVGARPGMKGIKFDNTQDSLFIDNTLTGHLDAVELIKVEGIVVSGNDISGAQGDGIRGGGWKHVDLTDNNIHDFVGVAYEVYHSDMIQLWSTWPHNYQNEDIEISGNLLDAGNGVATQTLLLQAEAFTNPSHPNYGVYNDDVRVHDNLIYNGHFHGVTLSNTTNAQVYNNTVLWNEDAGNSDVTGQALSTEPPTIRLTNSPNATVQDNVAKQILVNGSYDHGDNFALNYTNSSDPNYAYDHVSGLFEGGDATLQDLQFDTGALDGSVGSPSFSWSGSATSTSSGASIQAPATTAAPTPSATTPTVTANSAADDGADTSVQDSGSTPPAPAAVAAPEPAQVAAPEEPEDAPAAAPEAPQVTAVVENEAPQVIEAPENEDATVAAADFTNVATAVQLAEAPVSVTEVPDIPAPEVTAAPTVVPTVAARPIEVNEVAQSNAALEPESASSSAVAAADAPDTGPASAPSNATAFAATSDKDADDGEFFLVKLIKSLFGGGDDSAPASAPVSLPATASETTLLSDLIPIVRSMPGSDTTGGFEDFEDEEEDTPFAA